MSDIKFFRSNGNVVMPLEGNSVAAEKSLQIVINVVLDIRFV